uniref:LRRNT domain-containing protein n=1 Tax=Periophthalmus magnuspinnatus TaxID=409849 RepID=A0A3B4A6B7_9GOBI
WGGMSWSRPAPGLLFLVTLLSPSMAQNTCMTSCICLPEIKYINCSSQNISETLPNFPFSTEYLDLSRNHIIQIKPYSLGNLLSLKILLLQDNMISFVSDGAFFSLPSLQKLDISHNLISYLGYGFSLGLNSLVELSLAFNNLTILENNIFNNLDSLVKLDLRANYIQQIKSQAFSSMTILRHLYLNENYITTLELATFSTLRSLEMLQLRQNKIGEIQPGVFTSLCKVVLLIVKVAHELCIAETVTVLILTGTVLITVVAAILMEKNKRQSLDKDCAEEQPVLKVLERDWGNLFCLYVSVFRWMSFVTLIRAVSVLW